MEPCTHPSLLNPIAVQFAIRRRNQCPLMAEVERRWAGYSDEWHCTIWRITMAYN